MEQRTEFALRAMQTLNFRALAESMGSAPRRATSGKSVFGAKGWPEWKKNRVDLRAVRNNCLRGTMRDRALETGASLRAIKGGSRVAAHRNSWRNRRRSVPRG